VRVVLADPYGSALYAYIKSGELTTEGDSNLEGIGIKRIVANFKDAPVDDAVRVDDRATVEMAHWLLREEGLFVGGSAALNVVEPYSAGIGGDLFAIVYLAREHRLVGLNASGWAGSGATPARLKAAGFDASSGMPPFGILSVDVPGAVEAGHLRGRRRRPRGRVRSRAGV